MTKKKRNHFELFKEWIAARGAEVLIPTSEWEKVRFRAAGETSIIYVNKTGKTSFTGKSREAWDAFSSNTAGYRLADREPKRRNTPVVIRTLIARDGNFCFYCGDPFTDELLPTKEHLVPRTAGGPEHISNLFLSCEPCNREVGHASAPEKIRYRDRKRRGIGARLLEEAREHVNHTLLSRIDLFLNLKGTTQCPT